LSNDGSTDQSPALCNKYAQLDPRVKVIHGKNAGAGEARNRAIDIAQGRYICFFDIDDAVSSNWLSAVYEHLERSKPQALFYGFREIDPFYHYSTPFRFKDQIYQSNADIRQDYVSEFLGLKFNNGFLWNKVYEHHFLKENHLRLENQRIQQDEVFNLLVYPKLDRLVTISDVLYDYYIYNSGNTRSRFIQDRLNIYRSVRDHFLLLYREWHLNDKRVISYVYKRFFNSTLDYINFNLHHPNAPYTSEDRNQLLEQLMHSSDIQECLHLMQKLNIVPQAGYNRQFYNALLDGDVAKYNRVRKSYYCSKVLRVTLRKLLNTFHK
jgi:glycosyltransferase involved in cell wall biosynthesis